MSNKEREDRRFAVLFPIAAREDEEGVEVLGGAAGTDEGIVDDAINQFEEESGSPVFRLTPEQARMTANRFCFSSSTWNAPWQPTGPKPTGEQRLN